MKAILVREFGPPEVMRLTELPDPSPGPGQLLVRIRAVGVNPVDTYIRSGTYARAGSVPYTPGRDAAGVVEKVGEGVRSFASRGPGVHLRNGDQKIKKLFGPSAADMMHDDRVAKITDETVQRNLAKRIEHEMSRQDIPA